MTSRSTARYTLAAIRLFNGGVALFAPETLARRLGADPQANGAVIYVLRMFGIRTVVIGTERIVNGGFQQTGIGIAVPGLFFNAFFRNRIKRIAMDTSNIADDLLTQMYHGSKKPAPMPAR